MTRAPWPRSDCGAALADVAVAAHDRDLARQHDVGRAHDAVDERVAAAVDVVELALGDGVVDVDRREEQLALLHLVEAVHAGRRLLGDAADAGSDLGPGAGTHRALMACSSFEELELSSPRGRRRDRASGTEPAFSNSSPCGPSASRRRRRRGSGSGRRHRARVERLEGAPPVLLERLALPGEDRDAGGDLGRAVRTDRDGRGRVVLGREDVAGLAQRTSAPRSTRVSISTAVWIVMWSEPEMRAPASGCLPAYSARRAIRPGISTSARAISLRPQSASARSATLNSNFVDVAEVLMRSLRS